MIRLECSNCRTVLTIDDAFAGGVCRCQQCGTIQTVPKPGTSGNGDEMDVKALFRRKARIESALNPYNDQLEKAADQMDSSEAITPSALAGITAPRRSAPVTPDDGPAAPRKNGGASVAGMPSPRSRAAASAAETATAPPPPAQRPSGSAGATQPAAGKGHFVPRPSQFEAAQETKASRGPLIFAAVSVVALIGAGVFAYLRLKGPAEGTATTQQTAEPQVVVTPVTPAVVVVSPEVPATTSPAPVPAAASRPSGAASICGVTLAGNGVVYIVDRAGCTSEGFKQMIDAVFYSIESLTASRQFRVVVWNASQPTSFPPAGLKRATMVSADECRKALGDTFSGSGSLASVLDQVLTPEVTDVVLLSTVEVDQATADEARAKLTGKSGIRFHGIAVGTDLLGDKLRQLTVDFGGQFRQRDISALE